MVYLLRAQRQAAGGHPGDFLAAVGAAYRLVTLMGFVGLAFALLGHSFSCFTRFRGGKGVATAAGGLLVLMPYVALISTGVWVIVFYATRYVSLASILAALCLPALAVLFGRGPIGIGVSALVALFVVIRHRANIRRLLKGTENKFQRQKPGGEQPPQEAES
jgi:glycerol-3-phosphate acyltransferase PlsY